MQQFVSDVKSEVQRERCLSEERLSPSLLNDENLHEASDLLLKLEVDDDYIEDNNDDTVDLQSENEDVSTNEDKEVCNVCRYTNRRQKEFLIFIQRFPRKWIKLMLRHRGMIFTKG